MRIFVNNVDSYVGTALCADLRRIDGVANRIFGTVTGEAGGIIPACVRRPVPRSNMKLLLKTLLSCSLIVYDLHNADAEEVEYILKALKDAESEQQITFVLVSSLMTWSKTSKKYIDADQPDFDEGELGENVEDEVPVPEEETEEDGAYEDEDAAKPKRPKPFRDIQSDIRVAPSHFNSWKSLETLTMALNSKDNLKAYVVGAGLLYGCGESALFPMLKSAWLGQEDQVIIGSGTNYIPLVHVRDCTRLIKAIAQQRVGDESNYLVCVDRSDLTQRKLVQGIVDRLGTTSFKVPTDIAPEQVALSDLAEAMTVDLRFRPSQVMMSPDFAWWSKGGILKEMNKVAAEFEKIRELRPVRVAIVGPPAVGKSHHAAVLGKFYNIPVITIADCIKHAEEGRNNELKEKLATFKTEFEEKTAEASAAPAKGKAAGTTNGAPPPSVVRYPSALLGECVKSMLKTNVCKFRGFILDGFPRTYEEAEAAFLCPAPKGEDDEEAEVEELAEGELAAEGEGYKERLILDTQINPDFVISVIANDDYCKYNLQKLPAHLTTSDTHNNESGFSRRISLYKANWENPSISTPLEFFAKWRITHLSKSIENQPTDEVQRTFRILVESKGAFNNFLPPPQTVNAAMKQKAVEKAEQRATEAANIANKMAENEFAHQQRRKTEDDDRLRQIENHEKQLLEAQSLPLRAYLMTFVVPALTEGLVEIARVAPEDPIDYLAEFLFTKASEVEAAGATDPAEFIAQLGQQQQVGGSFVPVHEDF